MESHEGRDLWGAVGPPEKPERHELLLVSSVAIVFSPKRSCVP